MAVFSIATLSNVVLMQLETPAVVWTLNATMVQGHISLGCLKLSYIYAVQKVVSTGQCIGQSIE